MQFAHPTLTGSQTKRHEEDIRTETTAAAELPAGARCDNRGYADPDRLQTRHPRLGGQDLACYEPDRSNVRSTESQMSRSVAPGAVAASVVPQVTLHPTIPSVRKSWTIHQRPSTSGSRSASS